MPKRLRTEQVEFYHTKGFLGPVDLLTTEEAVEVRRHIEEIEAGLGIKMMSRFRIKAHLPFPFLCDLVSHPKLLDAVEDLIGPNILCWGSSFFQKERETKPSSHGTRTRLTTGLNHLIRSPRGSPSRKPLSHRGACGSCLDLRLKGYTVMTS